MLKARTMNSFIASALISIVLYMPGSALALYALDASYLRWGTPTTGASVPVCYTAAFANQPIRNVDGVSFGSFSNYLATIREGAESAWSRAANIRFTGWGPCPETPPASWVVLHFTPDLRPDSASLGYPIVITLRPSNSSSTLRDYSNIAAHEFGHALGFWHENKRSDNPFFSDPASGEEIVAPDGSGIFVPSGCGIMDDQDPVNTSPPSIFLTSYDNLSIMSRCGQGTSLVDRKKIDNRRGEDGLRTDQLLSPGDVRGAIKAYGKKPSGKYVYSGNALGSGRDAFGRPLFSSVIEENLFWNGVQANRQQWIVNGNYCVMTVAGIIWPLPCGTFPDEMQRWDIELSPFFPSSGRIKLVGTDMCVTVQGDPNVPGTPLRLATCQSTPAANEIFTFTEYDVRLGDRCVHYRFVLTLNDCRPAGPTVNQGGMDLGYSIYFFRGPLIASDGRCITASTIVNRFTGRPSWYLDTCSASNQQVFDIWN